MSRTVDFVCMACGTLSQICGTCRNEGHVCEDHPDRPWADGDGCCGAAGMPCRECCDPIPEDGSTSILVAFTPRHLSREGRKPWAVTETIELESIKRLDIQPGDILVATLPSDTTREALDFATRQLSDHLPDGVRLLVVTNVEFHVMSAEQEIYDPDYNCPKSTLPSRTCPAGACTCAPASEAAGAHL